MHIEIDTFDISLTHPIETQSFPAARIMQVAFSVLATVHGAGAVWPLAETRVLGGVLFQISLEPLPPAECQEGTRSKMEAIQRLALRSHEEFIARLHCCMKTKSVGGLTEIRR